MTAYNIGVIGEVGNDVEILEKHLKLYDEVKWYKNFLMLGNFPVESIDAILEVLKKFPQFTFYSILSGKDSPDVYEQMKTRGNLSFLRDTYRQIQTFGAVYGLDHSFNPEDPYHREDDHEKILSLYKEKSVYQTWNSTRNSWNDSYNTSTYMSGYVFGDVPFGMPSKQAGSLGINQILQSEANWGNYFIVCPTRKMFIKYFATQTKNEKRNLFLGVPPLSKDFITNLHYVYRGSHKYFGAFGKPYESAIKSFEEAQAKVK